MFERPRGRPAAPWTCTLKVIVHALSTRALCRRSTRFSRLRQGRCLIWLNIGDCREGRTSVGTSTAVISACDASLTLLVRDHALRRVPGLAAESHEGGSPHDGDAAELMQSTLASPMRILDDCIATTIRMAEQKRGPGLEDFVWAAVRGLRAGGGVSGDAAAELAEVLQGGRPFSRESANFHCQADRRHQGHCDPSLLKWCVNCLQQMVVSRHDSSRV